MEISLKPRLLFLFVSEDTRELILNRKALQEEAAKTKCKILMKEFNFQCKEVKKAVAKDEKEFFEKGFDFVSNLYLDRKSTTS